jgi:hypothetical protein
MFFITDINNYNINTTISSNEYMNINIIDNINSNILYYNDLNIDLNINTNNILQQQQI